MKTYLKEAGPAVTDLIALLNREPDRLNRELQYEKAISNRAAPMQVDLTKSSYSTSDFQVTYARLLVI